jgi:hypothetical protein
MNKHWPDPANHIDIKYFYVNHSQVHCTENPIYVFPEKELCDLSPTSYIHVSVSDLYIPRIGPHIWLQQNRQNDPGNIQISHIYMSVGIGIQNIMILFWK